MNNVIAFIQSMEQSEGLKSSDTAISSSQTNFEAANEIIKMLGGTLELKPYMAFDAHEGQQDGSNMIMYINALMVRELKGRKNNEEHY